MATKQEQIEKIEKEIRETPYHKGTEHHIGKLRAKLSKLRSRLQESSSKGKGGGGGYAVKKQGDATIVLVGAPSVGKSTLLNKLTNAKSKIAPYAFTTLSVIPGMMEYKDAKIQILDVPGLITGAEEGKGRGREVLSVARGADLIILMTDVDSVYLRENLKKTLYENGVRLDTKPPEISIDKKVSGGITIHSNIKQEIDEKTIKEVAQEMGFKNGEITVKEKLTMDRLIDAFSANRVYIPSLSVVNKADLIDYKPKQRIKVTGANLGHPSGESGLTPVTYISAEEGEGLEKFKEKIWKKLGLIRLYLVRPDEEPGFDNPLIVKSGASLDDVAKQIGEEFAKENERAKIWGVGAKFPGQEVSLSTKVQEKMQVRFI